MILDIAAGILIVLGVLAMALGLAWIVDAHENVGEPAIGWVILLIGLGLAIAVTAHRHLGWVPEKDLAMSRL